MKKLIAYPTLIILLFAITNCGSKPSEMDGIKELEKAYNNLARVVNFKKTDGKLTEFKGVNGYEMEYEAEIEFLADVFDKTIGPKITGQTEKSLESASKLEIRNITVALDGYEMDNQAFPTTEQGLKALMEKPTLSPVPRGWDGPYIKKEPTDPWGNPYQYLCSLENGSSSYNIWSLGDRKEAVKKKGDREQIKGILVFEKTEKGWRINKDTPR